MAFAVIFLHTLLLMCESLQTSDIWLTCHSLASGRTPAGPPSQRKARTPLWSGYQQGSPAREQAIVAHEQGQLFGVEITSKVQRGPLIAYLDETVSGWTEALMCSICWCQNPAATARPLAPAARIAPHPRWPSALWL